MLHAHRDDLPTRRSDIDVGVDVDDFCLWRLAAGEHLCLYVHGLLRTYNQILFITCHVHMPACG